jgi:NAD(P) transhydrogenase subunit beta
MMASHTDYIVAITPPVAESAHAVNPWVAAAYLVSGVLFILALRGLSSPATSRAGNRFGMIGMLIAVVTTLVTHFPRIPQEVCSYIDPCEIRQVPDWATVGEMLAAIAIGGTIGLVIARRIQMTAMPQLVAAFHSLVGLAAVLVACAAYFNPAAFGIVDPESGKIAAVSTVEMGLGVAIGAITFSGSVIAFLKLNGNMSGTPILLPLRHWINIGIMAAILGGIGTFTGTQGPGVFFTIVALSFLVGFLLIIPNGGADIPVVVSMLNSYSGWAAAEMWFNLHNTAMIITRALVRS